ncbi:N-6 DNA methylase [Sedimentibacter hydroxybenzoicus DSM 7310]|uniref:site-specific DNA-methyltransferase (adenine-specific) n=1 Tax=Sedimentibacter hydroxybenzoicus DSM 7310 TaxID=1123245 RepID=A0A974BJW6_SEDHY|nr:N-6 DNA methylase [Sedimentibacter hydroxybenzoicus]NYB74538.1 N-6 DNA methylase [Sedimentibacter hydroxybenzoicus DSM 7310]
MKTIENIIDILGYKYSESLFYRDNIFRDSGIKKHLTSQMYRIITEINPDAVYCADNKPFIVFFDISNNEHKKSLFKKIWNAQIPVVFFNYEDRIEIYNGCSLKLDTHELMNVDSLQSDAINEFSDFSFWNVTNESFWLKYKKSFDAPKIDSVMLDNIKYITDLLKKSSCKDFAVKLVLRLIFIRFLIDRGVDLDYPGFNESIESSKESLLKILQSKNCLYNLFIYLKDKFNGNLFELYVNGAGQSEEEIMEDSVMGLLYDLMSGQLEIRTNQWSLFPLYDFNIIPIELISNIYERFLGEKRQKEDSAFYTPPYLVDYILNQTIKPYLNDHKSCKVLDPACGSGIFLVETLRSIIEANISEDSYINDDEKLIELIKNNIFGIDKNGEAIDVAIFSMYVTILDYKDPKSLKNFKLPYLKETNFFENDFFDDGIEEVFKGVKFDFIIGNPPWGRIDGGLHIDYCRKNKYEVQNNEISRSFIYRTKDFCCDKTKCCLIVTSKIFYNSQNPAVKFREWLLTNSKIMKFIELSAVRELVFKHAKGPAAVVFYTFSEEKNKNLSNDITHIVLMPNVFFSLFNIIVVEKINYKYIKQIILFDNDWAWKTIVFGTSKDFLLLKKMKSKYKNLKMHIENNNLLYGTGIQTQDGKKDASHLLGKKIIDPKGITSFYVDTSKYTVFNKRSIHRIRNEKLFEPPYVLIKKGFNIKTYKLKAAYSEEEFLYSDAITGIVGKDKNLFLSLMGLINSSLYAYFNLMLGTSAGIEREQGFPTDILKFPALVDSEIANLTESIVDLLSNDHIMQVGFNEDKEEKIRALDEYVLKCFNLENNSSIDYVLNIQIPLLSGGNTYKEVSDEQLKVYSEVITDYFDDILKENNQFIEARVYKKIMSHYSAVEFTIVNDEPMKKVNFVENEKRDNLELFSKFMIGKTNDMFFQIKDIINFEENSFYILKTNDVKNWHEAIAELDLSDILNSILSQKEELR